MNKFLIFLFLMSPSFVFAQNVVINEIMASNQATILDEDGDTPDWIELYNSSTEQVNLYGYSLSDDTLEIQKWQFGNAVIKPGEHLVVFASDKDLNKVLSHWETIITEGDTWKYQIGNASNPANWIDPSYDDSAWNEGPSGFGYADNDDSTDLQNQSPFISLFIRKIFTIENINTIIKSVLHVDYDDGFVAYINGVEAARAGMGEPGNQPAWDDRATSHEAVMYVGGAPERFDIDGIKDLLVAGENTIAIEVHNTNATSTDMSLIPFLSLGMTEVPVGSIGAPEILGLEISGSYFHTNFKVSASGERIMLSDTSGTIIDQVNVPASISDISYARINDGSLPWIFQFASPGSTNTGDEFQGFADSVCVSLPGGFYASTISVALSAGDYKIFYTLDGSDPDSNSTEFSTPINIQKTTVLKAISLNDNHFPGPIIYHTYFINEHTDLPVVSLSTDPYNLFDYNYGIYANGPGWTPNPPNRGANFWMDWERPAHVEFFDDDKNPGFSKNCGIAIYGAWSRSFAQKSFSVKFKNIYNANALEYPLFPGFDVTTFKSFLLRNSGNDFQYTHIRDAMMQTLIKDLDIDYLEYRPATTFINGEYWGIYNIREKINEHYVANRHGVDPDNIDLLEGNMEVIHGDSEHYQQLIDYISTHNMARDEAYDFVNMMIDLDECLLYFAAEVYYNSQDWPANNVKFWRERSETGKWRWILFDVDFGFNLYESNGQAEDHLYYLLCGIETRPGSNPPWSTLLPRKLVENPKIKIQFINLIADILNTNFKSARVVNIINEIANHIASEITKHRNRFGINGENLNKMIAFAQERPGYLRGFVRNFFNCGDDCSITINSTEGGKIKLNFLSFEPADLPWSGVYFQNNPVTVKAIANDGYKFDGWTGTVYSQDVTLILSGNRTTSLNATFSVDSSVAKEIVINEINYHSSDLFDSGDWIELYNRSDQTIDLSDWIFTDSNAAHSYTFPTATVLEPGQYLVLVENDSAFTARFPDVMNYVSEMDFGLGGSGEFIKLVNEEGQLIDSLTYDDESPWPTAAAGSGATLELLDPASDNSKAENWQASSGHGSPGKKNSVVSSIEEIKKAEIPEKFSLFQNYPNPFNPSTTILYQIPKQCHVTLSVFNTSGQLIETIVSDNKSPGEYSILWNVNNLCSGIYFYKLVAGDYVSIRKMIIIK